MSIQEPQPTKWALKREESYRRLVEAAARQFHDSGYAATRVEDIVSDAGYTSGAFYFHFANKTECFWHVVAARQRARGNWWRLVDDLDPATTSLVDVLGHVFAHFDRVLEGLNDWILVMVDFHQQHRGHGDQDAKLADIYREWREELVQFVQALQKRGWIAASDDPKLVAVELFAFAEGLRTHARMYGLDPADERAATIDGLTKILDAR